MSLLKNTTFLYMVIAILASVSIISLALSYKPAAEQSQKNQTGRYLPVDIDSTGIKTAGLTYHLTGTLIAVEPADGGALWKVQTEDKKEYSFFVMQNASIFPTNPLKDPNASPSASITPLTVKKGAKITAFIGYDLKNNKANSGRIILE